jgi:hypothetical protein
MTKMRMAKKSCLSGEMLWKLNWVRGHGLSVCLFVWRVNGKVLSLIVNNLHLRPLNPFIFWRPGGVTSRPEAPPLGLPFHSRSLLFPTNRTAPIRKCNLIGPGPRLPDVMHVGV